ncbi:MAG: metal-dependent hydrolase [Calditrichaceae bacterium]|nr:metal-dependent hydrolase [Calditrichaceae bacterium]MBN2709157.1 metal-dependent hydrolase [Calditrichaceae bacterium]RQV96113.1 MAG: metal-dependent hydrolase [Calditrichota bacterium]
MVSITYLSHSAWLIKNGEHTILIDPFLSGNPLATVKKDDVKADYIIVTHAHGDHLGDAIPIARANKSLIITNFEIANYCSANGVSAHSMHIGGGHNFPFGRVKLTPAWHGSSFPDGSYGGTPAGVLITIDGKTIYHSGDTGLFLDMQLIGQMNSIDVFLVCIGDNFTMDINDAVKAVEFVKPKLTIPMHYNTFDVIRSDPEEFARKVKEKGFNARILGINESYSF